MRPTGRFIPLLLLFPRKYMKPELMNGTPPELIVRAIPRVDTEQDFHPVFS
jgi:hypothetical protein